MVWDRIFTQMLQFRIVQVCVLLLLAVALASASASSTVSVETDLQRDSTQEHNVSRSRKDQGVVQVRVNKSYRKFMKVDDPNHSKLVRLFCKIGLFLSIQPKDKRVVGTVELESKHVYFMLESYATSIVRIKGWASGLYIAMEKTGKLYAEPKKKRTTLFYELQEENLFTSYASVPFYMNKTNDMFLGIKHNGRPKSGLRGKPGQDPVQFVPMIQDVPKKGNKG